jgi:glycine/D-amino acid oxidase-like deaminating enzyme
MTTPRPRPSHDVVIVGARAAGAATALLLARAGLDVLVVARGRYGADTLHPRPDAPASSGSTAGASRRRRQRRYPAGAVDDLQLCQR